MSFKYPKNKKLYAISVHSRLWGNRLIRPRLWGAVIRNHKRKKRLRIELGREPNMGDVFADICGMRADDERFQAAIRESMPD